MEPLPCFPLFADPVQENVLIKSAEACAVCGRARGWVYDGPVYREGCKDPRVCPWCIADGSAAAGLSCSFNSWDFEPATAENPLLSAEERDWVMQRTPGFTTWQGNYWRRCCGHACVYLGQAGEGDVLPRGRWAAAADALLADWPNLDARRRRELLHGIGMGSPCAYVFRCRVCGKLGGYVDFD